MLYELKTTDQKRSQGQTYNILYKVWSTTLGGFSNAWHRYRTWRNRMKAIRQLQAMEDFRLVDVGIAREDIRRAVEGLLERSTTGRGQGFHDKPRHSDQTDEGYKDAA